MQAFKNLIQDALEAILFFWKTCNLQNCYSVWNTAEYPRINTNTTYYLLIFNWCAYISIKIRIFTQVLQNPLLSMWFSKINSKR